MFVQKDIENLKKEVSLMARKAESILEKAITAMETKDAALVEEIKTLDKDLDNFEISLDAHCAELLALKDPYAIDFRFIFSVIKTTRDLERVGDESKTIGKWSLKMNGDAEEDLKTLGKKAKASLNTAITALINLDADTAEKVTEIEEEVDEIEDRIIESNPDLARAFIAKAFERISDMATNIAENVIFCVKAEDIRHGGVKKI
ncbi:MAG: phosphate signaling complex protein PhoU [Spirochaetia bacterium]|nr:phosphate signaling complex protein PhoU [Spirochaetia bacterium]